MVKNLPANAEDTCSDSESRRSPREEMTIYSSILAWRILWTGQSGGLQSMGLQRVRHDLATKQ